jgi:hypothetical protein
MSDLVQQAVAISNTCKTVLAGKSKQDYVDATTLSIAQAIIEEAKLRAPNDKILEVVKFQVPLSWTNVLAAMETVIASLE